MTRRRRAASDSGSAVAEFVMVSVLVLVLGMGLLQLALILYVRNTLISCASEGAVLGARLGAGPDDAVLRTRDLVRRTLSPAYADDVQEAAVRTSDGVEVVEVTVTAPLPVVGLLGPAGSLTVHGRAFVEAQR